MSVLKVIEILGNSTVSFEEAVQNVIDEAAKSVKNIKSVYLPHPFIRMQLGGASTGGLSSTILLNKEVLRALRKNGIYTNLMM